MDKSTRKSILTNYIKLMQNSVIGLSSDQRELKLKEYLSKYNDTIKNIFGDEMYISETGSDPTINAPFRTNCD